MIDLSFDAAKRSFFDKGLVMAHSVKMERAGVTRAASFVRTTAQTSMRPRKKTAQPGTPPSAHRGDLRRHLYFVFDTASWMALVGPVLFGVNKEYQDPRAPRTLETGAVVSRRVLAPIDPAQKAKRRARPRQAAAYKKLLRQGRLTRAGRAVAEPKVQSVKYRAFPFMKPALLTEVRKGTIPQAFQGQFGR